MFKAITVVISILCAVEHNIVQKYSPKMLYLEDYVEMIEHLPQELRDRFTDMREMDLGVQNNMDSLEKRLRVLFGSCRRNEITTEQANTEFSDIQKGYSRTLEEADEKVNLANQMYELVDRYLRRLDTELYKIKCELEADNKGITEVLEKRSLELDMPVTTNTVPQTNYHKENRYRHRPEKRRDSWGGVGGPSSGSGGGGRPNVEGRTLVAATAPLALSRTDSAIQAALSRGLSEVNTVGGTSSFTLGHGAGSAIAVAASQAIAATQQMQHGRRTATLKASYEAINAAAAAAASNTGLTLASGASVANLNVGIGSALNTTIHHEPHSAITHHSTGHHSSGHITSSHHASGHHSSSHYGTSASSSSSANKRHKKKSSSSYSSNTVSGVSNLAQNLVATPTASRSSSPNLGVGSTSAAVASASLSAMNVDEQLTDSEWNLDPNEPRYCVCNQVSYGDMVACDNEDCPFEWFHYACVGVTAPPKGKWYCPQCNANRRNRSNRKN